MYISYIAVFFRCECACYLFPDLAFAFVCNVFTHFVYPTKFVFGIYICNFRLFFHDHIDCCYRPFRSVLADNIDKSKSVRGEEEAAVPARHGQRAPRQQYNLEYIPS
jgi:hypothetical protein